MNSAHQPAATLLTIEQAADRLGVSTRFIRRLVNERRVAFHKVGKFVRFKAADLERFIADGRVEPFRPERISSTQSRDQRATR